MNLSSPAKTEAVGVVVPVHNEQDHLPAALDALHSCLRRLPSDLPAHTVLVLDACSDDSRRIATRWRQHVGEQRVTIVDIEEGNVGMTRATGCDVMLRRHPGAERRLWLATTDADSQVPANWLTRQVALHDEGVSLWNGIVTIVDWTGRPSAWANAWDRFYADDETPIHGASLGINAELYRRAGGFQALATGEDRALHAAAMAVGANVVCDRSVPVVTSARRTGRAPQGFAGALTSFEMTRLEMTRLEMTHPRVEVTHPPLVVTRPRLEAALRRSDTPDSDPPRAVLSN